MTDDPPTKQIYDAAALRPRSEASMGRTKPTSMHVEQVHLPIAKNSVVSLRMLLCSTCGYLDFISHIALHPSVRNIRRDGERISDSPGR